jgi:hypothetical protein
MGTRRLKNSGVGKMKEIIFTDTLGIPEIYYPKPANKQIPNWYKEIISYVSNEKKPDGKGKTTQTIKKCMPVFDAISSGYLIFSYTDIYVSMKNGEPWYEWPSFHPIELHSQEQAYNHPSINQLGFPKWINPWSIQTPKGYSSLFIQPVHRESIFTIMTGVVDTDTYRPPVNFPFTFNDPNFEGMIPAGTPIAQVVPFKRDSWQMVFKNQENIENINKDVILRSSKFFDSYKTLFRQNKEYN